MVSKKVTHLLRWIISVAELTAAATFLLNNAKPFGQVVRSNITLFTMIQTSIRMEWCRLFQDQMLMVIPRMPQWIIRKKLTTKMLSINNSNHWITPYNKCKTQCQSILTVTKLVGKQFAIRIKNGSTNLLKAAYGRFFIGAFMPVTNDGVPYLRGFRVAGWRLTRR